ncbi:conserved hypothetical protein [Vibrio crassostreae]|jgi:hypothetical protein|uniref:Uncharacterized protein n=2 Tax=Vibrio cyclitrophicus TaxID=47951 RepID=A0A7Z1S424_9VIBR|nr:MULTISPECIES: hypothetical protein [Vibrio]CAH6906107.1 conserved hypothetical protein [Vibrio chagasii]MCC4789112.1 hypothetical protein [Vibrio splendidus]MDH5935545.1 hypothetical protein [Vibrio splendidus]PMN40060.1 hypothetical protein BCT34_02745 [Vibrio sp. 10N.261.45.E2]PMN47245.1 hypothetical protein BCT32_09650 [Vibrio sp. 10N.261.45.E11]
MQLHHTHELNTTSNPFETFDENIIMFLEHYQILDFSFESLKSFLKAEYCAAKKTASLNLTYQEWASKNDEYVSTVSSYFIYKNWLMKYAPTESNQLVTLH